MKNLVRRYYLKKRGVAAGVKLTLELRDQLREKFVEFLGHAMIVMIEDFPPEDTDLSDSPDPWHELTLAAGMGVSAAMLTGSWFHLPITLMTLVKGSQMEFALFAPDLLVEELEQILNDCPQLENVGLMTNLEGSGLGIWKDALNADVVSDITLHEMIVEKTGELYLAGKSYVKLPSYRHHKKLIHQMQGVKDED